MLDVHNAVVASLPDQRCRMLLVASVSTMMGSSGVWVATRFWYSTSRCVCRALCLFSYWGVWFAMELELYDVIQVATMTVNGQSSMIHCDTNLAYLPSAHHL